MSIEYIVPRYLKINELKAALKSRFSIHQDSPISLQRDYQDSFDWRLYHKNARYFVEQIQSNIILNLTQGNADKERKYIFRWNLRPVFADDLPAGVLKNRLRAITGIRALLTTVSLRLRRNTLRYVDRDEKTHLFMHVEDWQVMMPDGKARRIGKRIRLEPVKGYEHAASRVTKYLHKTLQLQAAEQDVYELGLACARITPGNYSSALEVPLDAAMRTDLALKKILLFSLDVMQANEQGIIDDIDSEFLHDFRVAVRRTRSALSQIKQVFPGSVTGRFMNGFKWLGAVTGPCRDMHVYLLKFDTYRMYVSEAMRAHLDPMHAYLEKHLQLEHKALARSLKSHRYRQLTLKWREFLRTEPSPHSRLANASRPVKQTADTHIWKAFRKIIKFGNTITDQCPDEKIHRQRILCKRLRYLLEFFHSLYPSNKMKPLIKSLKQLQNVLGDFQDLSVQANAIHQLQQNMQQENLMSQDTCQAMEQLAEYFTKQQSELRAAYVTHFARFSGASNRVLYEKLFKQKLLGSQASTLKNMQN